MVIDHLQGFFSCRCS